MDQRPRGGAGVVGCDGASHCVVVGVGRRDLVMAGAESVGDFVP